jgi:hypothetical protein
MGPYRGCCTSRIPYQLIFEMDNVIVERPLKKQNLCLDKGYDFPEIERESIKKEDTCRIFVTEV